MKLGNFTVTVRISHCKVHELTLMFPKNVNNCLSDFFCVSKVLNVTLMIIIKCLFSRFYVLSHTWYMFLY